MPHDDFEDWRTLCELAAKEEDPERLMDLVQRLNKALDQRNGQDSATFHLAFHPSMRARATIVGNDK
jgi:hypothetical protein